MVSHGFLVPAFFAGSNPAPGAENHTDRQAVSGPSFRVLVSFHICLSCVVLFWVGNRVAKGTRLLIWR